MLPISSKNPTSEPFTSTSRVLRTPRPTIGDSITMPDTGGCEPIWLWRILSPFFISFIFIYPLLLALVLSCRPGPVDTFTNLLHRENIKRGQDPTISQVPGSVNYKIFFLYFNGRAHPLETLFIFFIFFLAKRPRLFGNDRTAWPLIQQHVFGPMETGSGLKLGSLKPKYNPKSESKAKNISRPNPFWVHLNYFFNCVSIYYHRISYILVWQLKVNSVNLFF